MRSVSRFLLTLSLLPIIWIATPLSSATAATGDTDTYFNLEANTASVNNYAIAIQDSAFHFNNAFTWEMWIYPTSDCSGIFCHITAKEEEYVFGIVDKTFRYALNGTGGGWVWIDTTIVPRINTWQHVTLTRAANINSVTLWVNGQAVYTGAAGALGTGNFATATTNFQVGARTGNFNSLTATPAQSYQGSIDELKMWNVARTQSEIQSDMHNYGPTNNAAVQVYFDFNDSSGSTIVNKASGAGAGSTLTVKNSPAFTALATSSVSSGTKIIKFPRTYLSANGWKPPVGISSLNALAVGGGGGGGNNVGNGGGGGGGYAISNLSVSNASTFGIKVGTGGTGGRNIIAGTLTYDGTTLMDGQSGESSIATIKGSSYTGGGGGGGDTIWSNNVCGGAGQLSQAGAAGTGSGTGGTAYTGGLGGAVSGTQATANGKTGFTTSITSGTYGSGGGAGGAWSGNVTGNGADSQGGTGNGSNGLNQTGSGGGGNQAGCAVGGNGGSGIVIFTFTAYSGEPVSITNATFRTATTVSVNVSEVGKVSFFAFGKIIPGCRSRPTVTSATITASCTWKPSRRGPVPITAKFVPTSAPSSIANINVGSVFVANRTGKRGI
jgi:hypothetical protein